jgi:hypothetical protein
VGAGLPSTSVAKCSLGQSWTRKIATVTASDDKLDIERHNVTPEAFGWQVVQTADGPDFIRVIDN